MTDDIAKQFYENVMTAIDGIYWYTYSVGYYENFIRSDDRDDDILIITFYSDKLYNLTYYKTITRLHCTSVGIHTMHGLFAVLDNEFCDDVITKLEDKLGIALI